jgi:chromosome segregation ATPase
LLLSHLHNRHQLSRRVAMSGIGEASAILTVAGAGFSLASKLKEILDDYKDAATTIERLREELEATSTSLQNLGQLAERNGLQNKNAVADTRKLTERCQRTISDIKSVLRLESVPPDPSSSNRETELTRLDRVKWVLSKSKLEVPRAELGRLKLDIMLLYLTLMTLRA